MRLHGGMALLVALAIARPAAGTGIISFEVGTFFRSSDMVAPSAMHGTYAFDLIKVKFDTDVFVDFYDLKLGYIGGDSNSIGIVGYSYDSATHTAYWNVDGQQSLQNARYRAVLSGIWDPAGVPLDGGGYTNEFSVLSGDVTGDGSVTPLDTLTIINYLNTVPPPAYDATLDVNWDGYITAADSLITINIINSGGVSLVGPGAYKAVPCSPPAEVRFTGVEGTNGTVNLRFTGVPVGSVAQVEGKGTLADPRWYTIQTFWVSNVIDHLSFPMLEGSNSEFYRVTFR